MSKAIIFVFTGTGNSLWAAREIAGELGTCEIASMGRKGMTALPAGYDAVGFVFPTYAGGIPRRVKEFVSRLDLSACKNAYFFAIATCGGIRGSANVIVQLRSILKRRNIRLGYGERLPVYSNYVITYKMDKKKAGEKTALADVNIKPMLADIKNHKISEGNDRLTSRVIESVGFHMIVHRMDRNFTVSDDCIKCGICRKVCPVNNITYGKDGKPQYRHHCEQCLACLQHCPVQAINYKDKTQGRGRYTHPGISWKDLAQLYGK